MARQDIAELGLDDEEEAVAIAPAEEEKGEKKKRNDGSGNSTGVDKQHPRTKEGFVAGLRPSPSKK